jgi:non-heme chloroperoxidase
VLALTPRGHGDSSKPADGYRFEDFAGDLAAFMDARRLDAAVVVAHSLSTWVVRRFAVDHPDRTLAIAMVGAPVGLAGNPVLQEMNGMFLAMPEPIDPGFVRELQSTVQPAPDEFIEAMVVECMKFPARVWRATAQAVREDDLSGELHRIAVPALVFVGGQDPLVPTSEAGTMVKVIPDARLLVYEHAGHAVHWEEPERFAADLVAFVESVVR